MENRSKKSKDPVCGMTVDADNTQYKCSANNKEYGFCCQGCMEKFKKNPNQYTEK